MGCSDSSGGLVGCFFSIFILLLFFYSLYTTTTEHSSVHLSLAMYSGDNYTNRHVLSVHT